MLISEIAMKCSEASLKQKDAVLRFRRASFEPGEFIEYSLDEENPFLFFWGEYDCANWAPTTEDLSATDWIVIEP